MPTPKVQTIKEQLQAVADKCVDEYRELSSGIILTGSLAYANSSTLNSQSDVDLVLITEDFRETLMHFQKDSQVTRLDECRYFEGCALSTEVDGKKVSIHILRHDVFEMVASAFVADLRMFRPVAKSKPYVLGNFLGERYDFKTTNVKLEDCDGYRTIIPIGFISEDKYYFGIHRDKFLSSPVVLHGEKLVAALLEKHWKKVTDIYQRERARIGPTAAFQKSLVKFERYSEDTKSQIGEKLKFYCR